MFLTCQKRLMKSPPTRSAPVPERAWTMAILSAERTGLSFPKINAETNFPYSGKPGIGAYSKSQNHPQRGRKPLSKCFSKISFSAARTQFNTYGFPLSSRYAPTPKLIF